MARRMQALGSHADKPPLEEGGGEEVHRQEEEEDHQQALEGVPGDGDGAGDRIYESG